MLNIEGCIPPPEMKRLFLLGSAMDADAPASHLYVYRPGRDGGEAFHLHVPDTLMEQSASMLLEQGYLSSAADSRVEMIPAQMGAVLARLLMAQPERANALTALNDIMMLAGSIAWASRQMEDLKLAAIGGEPAENDQPGCSPHYILVVNDDLCCVSLMNTPASRCLPPMTPADIFLVLERLGEMEELKSPAPRDLMGFGYIMNSAVSDEVLVVPMFGDMDKDASIETLRTAFATYIADPSTLGSLQEELRGVLIGLVMAGMDAGHVIEPDCDHHQDIKSFCFCFDMALAPTGQGEPGTGWIRVLAEDEFLSGERARARYAQRLAGCAG